MPPAPEDVLNPFFTDVFGVDPEALEEYGAFNISLVTDLPLFIDPFLIFTSDNPQYQALHRQIVDYIVFLRDRAAEREIDDGLARAWMVFSEVKQTWLGFAEGGNRGAGLGFDFAQTLRANLHAVFGDFGTERITRGSHLEKLCLVRRGVGRDKISDFTTNLIKSFLAEYTEAFAREHLDPSQARAVSVPRVRFDYARGTWVAATFTLPWFENDYVLLTPRDLLTRDETWINRSDLLRRIEEIVRAVPDEQLRSTFNEYFRQMLPKQPKQKDREAAAAEVVRRFPEIADYYIRDREDSGARASSVAREHVVASENRYIGDVRALSLALAKTTPFYTGRGDTLAEARQRIAFLKHVIEDQDGYRYFFDGDTPLQREKDLQILFKLVWFGTPSDVNAEVNNGRGPVDFKISRGALDKTLVEFKLASNRQLKANLAHQLEIYQKANATSKGLKVVLFFTDAEYERVQGVRRELSLLDDDSIILIDARPKVSASKVS